MGTADQVEIVLVKELCNNVLAKSEGNAAVILSPSINVLIRIGPKKITKKAGIGNVRGADDALDLIETGELGGQATVRAEDFLIDDTSAGEAVEAVCESLPQLNAETALALVIETVDAVNGRTLVVATENEEVFRILDLVGEQDADRLEGLLATVNVVTKENVIRLGRKATVFEKAKQIVVLSMDVTTNLDGGLKFQKHWLANQQITTAEAEHLDLRLGQIHLLSGTGSSDAETSRKSGRKSVMNVGREETKR